MDYYNETQNAQNTPALTHRRHFLNVFQNIDFLRYISIFTTIQSKI